MPPPSDDEPGDRERTRGLLAEAWSRHRSARYADAADLFGRALLVDPASVEARKGLEEARAAGDEAARRLEAGLEEARLAIELGDGARARALLEDVVHGGGDRDRALALLDRLDDRGGRIETPPGPASTEGAAGQAQGVDHGRGWLRPAFAFGWALVFVGLAAGVASRWDVLLGRLESAPRALAHVSSTALPAPTTGELAVADARRRLEKGDAAGALAALDRVAPEEPAYPFARQLRRQAESAVQARMSRP